MHIGSDAGLVKEKVKSHGHYLMSALQVVGLKKLSNKKENIMFVKRRKKYCNNPTYVSKLKLFS